MSTVEEQDPRRSLSPVRVESRPVDLPYGLTWAELRSCLPQLAGARELQAYASHAIQGLHGTGNSSILTLAYAEVGEEPREVIIFVKQINDARQAESTKHSFLKTQGMPLANLLQISPRGDGEVLVLEFLPTIGTEPDEADDLLALIAQLNAVADPPSELFRPAPGAPKVEFEQHVHDALIPVAPDVDPAQWLELYRRVGREVDALPVALNHGELHFQQVGWSRRDGAGELVMFDLATVALLPALTDVAGMLRPLSAQTGRDEHELFASYLGSLNRRTGAPIDEHEAWHDLCLTRIVRSFESLPWVVAMNDHPDVSETGTDVVKLLQRDLGEVGLL